MASTTTANLAPTTQTYFKRLMLDVATPTFQLYNHTTKQSMPKNSGRTMSFRRMANDTTVGATLNQGENPTVNNMTSSEVTATLAEIGRVWGYTSAMTQTDAIDPEVEGTIRKLAATNAQLTLDTLCQTEFLANGQVLIGNSKTTANLATTDTLSVRDIRTALVAMRSANVMPYENGMYHAVFHPVQVNALKSDSATGAWADYKYTSTAHIEKGETKNNSYLGTLDGCEIYSSSIIDTETINSVTAYRGFVFGDEHTASVELNDNSGFEVIVKKPGESGISDSLNRIGTIGWKSWFVAKNLDTSAASSKNARLVILKTA